MKDSKLLTLLCALESEEIRWFYKYVKSPFYNSNQHLILLFEYLRKYEPSFQHPKLTKEAAFTKLFPGEAFDAKRMRLLMHRLANLLESFLVSMRLRREDFEFRKLLTVELGERNVYDQYVKRTDELLANLEAQPYRDRAYYIDQHNLYLQLYNHPLTNRQGKKKEESLYRAMDHLDTYFALSKIQLGAAVQARERLFASKTELKFYTEVIRLEEELFEGDHQEYKIFQLLAALQAPASSADLFDTTNDYFFEHASCFRTSLRKDIMYILLNYCARKTNAGNTDFVSKALGLYKYGLKEDFLLINKELSETTFVNIVGLGVVSAEFEWTRNFIDEYSGYLNEKGRADAVALSFGTYYFYMEKFEDTIHVLLTHTFANHFQGLSAKSFLLRSYFEQLLKDDSYYDLVIAYTNTFEKYIRNHPKVSRRIIEGYLKSIKFVRRLVNGLFQNRDLEKIFQQIADSENVMLKSWFLNKRDAL